MTAIVEDLLMLMISFVLANLRALMLERRGAMGTKRADKPENRGSDTCFVETLK